MAINEINDLKSVENSPIVITDLKEIENKEILVSNIENIPILKGPKGDTGDKGEQGEIGPQGPEGPQGEQGIQGEKGEIGPANTLKIGTVEKGEEASVTIEGEAPNQTLNFVLPKGDKGDKGNTGEQGPPGESYDDSEIRKIIADEKNYKYFLNIIQDTELGAEIEIPCYYKVGQDVLDVYYVGQRLIKCSTDDDEATGHYSEVGDLDSISNKIKITNDWKASSGNYFEFVVRGEYNV